jgi:hypothetical protein
MRGSCSWFVVSGKSAGEARGQDSKTARLQDCKKAGINDFTHPTRQRAKLPDCQIARQPEPSSPCWSGHPFCRRGFVGHGDELFVPTGLRRHSASSDLAGLSRSATSPHSPLGLRPMHGRGEEIRALQLPAYRSFVPFQTLTTLSKPGASKGWLSGNHAIRQSGLPSDSLRGQALLILLYNCIYGE